MDGGSGEGQRSQGGLGGRGLPCCHAEFDYTACPDYWPEPCSPGEGPGQREDQGSGKGGPHISRGTKGPQSETPLREGNPHSGGSQLHQVQGIQLDQPTCLPIMWRTASPGELAAATPPHWPGQDECWGSFLLLCGFVWAFLRSRYQSGHRPGRPQKGRQDRLGAEGRQARELLATLDDTDPLREDLQPQLDQLRKDLRDPRQPGARLDSAVAKQKKAEAKVARCEEALRQAEDSLRLAREERAAADSELKAAREAAAPAPAQPTLPQGDAGLRLSSEDMVGLTDVLKQCGLLAVAAQEAQEQQELGEGTGKRPRVGPYGAAEFKRNLPGRSPNSPSPQA